MAILVYKLTCAVSGKSYVGITSRSLDTRWLEHCKRAREGIRESRLYAAMRKYGLDAFTREIVATADSDDEARTLERHHILTLGTFARGYNSNPGGYGFLHFPEHVRKKIGDAQRGKTNSPEARRKMSEAKAGRPECASNFGDHVLSGSNNPRAASFRVRFPDGHEQTVTGIRAFCRDHNLSMRHLKNRLQTKGYSLIGSAPVSLHSTEI